MLNLNIFTISSYSVCEMLALFLSASKNTLQGKKNDSVEMFKFLGPKPFLNIIFLKRKIIIMKSGLSSA